MGVGLALGAFWLWRTLFPPAEIVIRRTLNEVAEAASFNAQTGGLARLAGLQRLPTYFTADTEIQLGGTGLAARSIVGREQLQELVASARLSAQSLEVQLRDVDVRVGEEQKDATAQIIVRARVDGDDAGLIQELRLRLVKEGRAWRIRRVEPVRTLQM